MPNWLTNKTYTGEQTVRARERELVERQDRYSHSETVTMCPGYILNNILFKYIIYVNYNKFKVWSEEWSRVWS